MERLIQTLKQQESMHLLPMIYREEGRWKELAEFLNEYPGLDAIERDADKLLEAEADQTFAAYENALDTYAERNTGRPYYREICGRLRTLSQWEGGEKRARKIIQKYRNKFKRRPAMMEELDKLGMD